MSKGAETRRAILDEALALSSTVGLENLTIGTLAKTVGMSKSGLFAHFSSKEALQIHVIEEAADRFVTFVVAPALRERRGEPRVRALFERWLDWNRAPFLPGGCPFVAAAAEMDDRPGPVRDRLVGAFRDWLDVLATAARTAVDQGHFRADLDVEQFAFEHHALDLGYHLYSRLLDDPMAEARVRASFERLLKSAR